MSLKPLSIHYSFVLSDGRMKDFEIKLDPETLLQVNPRKDGAPWTRLEAGKCSNCPLKPETSPHCPIALNISDLFETFKDDISHSMARVTVKTAERTYVNEIPLQQGLFGILGVLMATSGCPVMSFLRPMARHHLPFASFEETAVRVVSMYLMSQYFKHKKGDKPDWDLAGLDKHYDEIQKVNQGIVQRLSTIPRAGDANANSITILDSFAKLLSMSLKRDLKSFESLFALN